MDATTGALMNRLKRGDIYTPEKAQRALENFFKESHWRPFGNLPLGRPHTNWSHGKLVETRLWAIGEHPRIRPSSVVIGFLIYLTTGPSTAMLIRRGRRMADYLEADCFAVWVSPRQRAPRFETSSKKPFEKHLNFARNLHIETRVLECDDVAEQIMEFARRNQITQILAARPKLRPWDHLRSADPCFADCADGDGCPRHRSCGSPQAPMRSVSVSRLGFSADSNPSQAMTPAIRVTKCL